MKSKEEIQIWLQACIATRLQAGQDTVLLDTPFIQYLFDPLVVGTMSVDLEEWLGVPIAPTVFGTYRDIISLAAWLTESYLPSKIMPDPIRLVSPESWQWEVLAKAFSGDAVLNFWIGEQNCEVVLADFFEAVIKDTFDSGGAVFSSPDRRVVFVWTWLGSNLEAPGVWKQRWYDILGTEGVKRYYGLYQAGDVALDSLSQKRSMLPDYVAVLPHSQGNGYGSHVIKWCFKYFYDLGYDIPFLLASSKRSAKLYVPLLGFYNHREVSLGEGEQAPVAVFMKPNAPDH